ncbi:MAG: hypothetical protein WCR53_04910, partial [Bacteroidaceae bacterium]
SNTCLKRSLYSAKKILSQKKIYLTCFKIYLTCFNQSYYKIFNSKSQTTFGVFFHKKHDKKTDATRRKKRDPAFLDSSQIRLTLQSDGRRY